MGLAKAFEKTFASQVVLSAGQLALGVVTAQYLGVDGRGTYSLFYTAVGLLGSLLVFGMPQATIYLRNKEKVGNEILLGNMALAFGFQAMMVFLIISLFPRQLESFLGISSAGGVLPTLGLTTLLFLVDYLVGGACLANHLYGVYAAFQALQAILVLGGTLLIVQFDQSVELAILVRAAILSVVMVAYTYAVWRGLGIKWPEISSLILAKEIKFGAKNYLQNLIGLLNYRIYFFLLSGLGSKRDVGIFSVAILFVEAIRFVPNVVGTILLPRLTMTGKAGEADALTAMVTRMTMAVSSIVMVILLLNINWLVRYVFGPDYFDAGAAAGVMLLGGVFGTIYQVMTRYFTSQNEQKLSMIAGGIGLVSAVGLGIVLIRVWGYMGAAYAFTGSAFVTGMAMLIFFMARSRIGFSRAMIIRLEDVKLIRTSIKFLGAG